MPVHTLDGGWIDLGALPLVIELMDNRRVAFIIASSPPDHRAEAVEVLQPDQSLLLLGAGLRAYARADTAMEHGARVRVLSPAEFMLSAAVIDVRRANGRLLLQQLAPQGFTWRPVAEAVIAVAGVYQTLFPAGLAHAGGYIVNTSPPGSDPLWVDPTGAEGADLSTAAMPVYPAPDSASAPGGWRIPPTVGDVTIMGPAGATFQAFCA